MFLDEFLHFYAGMVVMVYTLQFTYLVFLIG